MSDFVVGLIAVLLYMAILATWFFTLFDLFMRRDIAG